MPLRRQLAGGGSGGASTPHIKPDRRSPFECVMADQFVVAQLKHAVALLALLNVLEKMEYRSHAERILVSEALRDCADRIEHRVLVQ